jgi:hypothetical protein
MAKDKVENKVENKRLEGKILADAIAEKYIGDHISILCARYWYRGVVKEVGDNYIVLSNPAAVEVTGSASATAPTREDPIPGDIVIAVDAIELVGQMAWSNAPLGRPGEER